MKTPSYAFSPALESNVTVFFELHRAGTFCGAARVKAAPTRDRRLGRAQRYAVEITIEYHRIKEWLPLFDAADMVTRIECSSGIVSDRVGVTRTRAGDDGRTATVVMEALVVLPT